MRPVFFCLTSLFSALLILSSVTFASPTASPPSNPKTEKAVSSANKLNNKSFTLFGLGIESLTYKEDSPIKEGTISTETTISSYVQRSGGYTPVSDHTGFYLKTASTLFGEDKTEDWELEGVGVIQLDEIKSRVAELEILGVWHLNAVKGAHLIMGVNSFSVSFNRSDFKTSRIQEKPLGAVSEDSFSLSGVIGYRYDTFFYKPDATIRFWAGVQGGMPLYYRVYNSGNAAQDKDTGEITQRPPVTLTNAWGGGFDLISDMGIGYRLTKNFTVNASVETAYRKRDLVREDNVSVPEVTVTTLRGLIGLFWSF